MSSLAGSGGRRRARTANDAAIRTGRQVVHVEHSVRIGRPVGELSDTLIATPTAWFPDLKAGRASIGLHVAGVPVRKKVVVAFGATARTSSWAVVPIAWKATSAEALFPVMTGKVSVSQVSGTETRLTVSGTYTPPLGKLGEDLNDALMRKVAKATVKELAERIAERLATAPT